MTITPKCQNCNRFNPELKIPPPVYTLIFALSIWAAHHFAPLIVWDVPALKYIAFVMMSTAALPVASAIFQFAKNRTTVNPRRPERASQLVTSGAYRFTRNPMYVSLLLLLSGWSLWLGSLSPLLFPPLFFLIITNWQIKPEERMLEKLFGQDYLAYKKRVRRWV